MPYIYHLYHKVTLFVQLYFKEKYGTVGGESAHMYVCQEGYPYCHAYICALPSSLMVAFYDFLKFELNDFSTLWGFFFDAQSTLLY